MTERTDLEKLSNQEIRELWKQTTDRARRIQVERQQNTATETASEEGFYPDAFGNMVEGVAPKRKEDRYYISPEGYVVYLAGGQKAPQLSGSPLCDWLNTVDVANDPEVREALGEEELYFEGKITVGESEILLTGRLESKGWVVDSRSPEDPKLNLGFRLSRSLTRDQALEQSIAYLESKAGPQFRQLTENEQRMCERMSTTNKIQALVFYVAARLPENLAEKFLQIGATGDDLAILRFVTDADVSAILEEASAHVFYWSNHRANEAFFDWVRANDDGRTWSLAFLEHCWNQYNLDTSIDRLGNEPPPTPEDFEPMSDSEIEKLLTDTRRLRAKNLIR